MFLKNITIKNFRCYDSIGITVDFSDTESVTAIIGKNGSGKTSILDAVNFLFGQDYLPTKICERDFHCDASGIKDKIVIEAETVKPFFTSIDVVSDRQVSSTILVPCNRVRVVIKRREKPEKVLDDAYVINKDVVPLAGVISDDIYKEAGKFSSYRVSSIDKIEEIDDIDELRNIVKQCSVGQATQIDFDNSSVGFYNVNFRLKNKEERSASFPAFSLSFNPGRLRNFPKAYYLTKNRDKDVSGDYSFVSKILGDLHWKWKRQLEKNTEIDDTAEKYDVLAQKLRGIVDEKGVLIRKVNKIIEDVCSEDIKTQIDFVDLEQPYKSAFIAKKEKDKLLLPENLGSGFNVIISYALFNYVAGLEKTPIILLIDEPELHLHVDWQLKMYNLFSSQRDLHIIYSTQSENLVSLNNWRQVKLVNDNTIYPQDDKLSEKVKSASNGRELKIEEYMDIYAERHTEVSLVLRENLELFFTKKIILVEGPGDKYALPKLLALNKCDINNYSVSIIPAWGKTKLKVYQMICKVFGINYFTMFDRDDAGSSNPEQNEEENKCLTAGAKGDEFCMFSSSLEKLLDISSETGDTKFQKLVKKIDDTTSADSLNQEIIDAISKIKNFIEVK